MEGKRHLLRKRKSDIGKADTGKTVCVIYKGKDPVLFFFFLNNIIYSFIFDYAGSSC